MLELLLVLTLYLIKQVKKSIEKQLSKHIIWYINRFLVLVPKSDDKFHKRFRTLHLLLMKEIIVEDLLASLGIFESIFKVQSIIFIYKNSAFRQLNQNFCFRKTVIN